MIPNTLCIRNTMDVDNRHTLIPLIIFLIPILHGFVLCFFENTGRALGFLLVFSVSSVYAAPGNLSVGFTGSHGSMGAFVDITANESLNVTGFDLNLAQTSVDVSVYYKSGATTMADTTNSGAWTFYQTINVTGNGQGVPTHIDITPFLISGGQTYAFYTVTNADGNIFNLDDPAPAGVSSASNAVMSILGAYESHGLFASTYNGWGWQGTVYYDTTLAPAAIPTMSEWGMILFSLMLAGAALWFIKRQTPMGHAV